MEGHTPGDNQVVREAGADVFAPDQPKITPALPLFRQGQVTCPLTLDSTCSRLTVQYRTASPVVSMFHPINSFGFRYDGFGVHDHPVGG